MNPEPAISWLRDGARARTRAQRPDRFIDQQLSPLFFRRTEDGPRGREAREFKDIASEEHFWGEGGDVVFGAVQLEGFRLTDWFPRAPGVYWSRYAQDAREMVWSQASYKDPALGEYFSPESKMGLIEDGGIGAIRLRPRRIDGEDCWLATALKGSACHCGIPLAVPDALLRDAGVRWGDRANLHGRVRFLQDAGLNDTAARVHHSRPLIIFVDKLEGTISRESRDPIMISPVALFESADRDSPSYRADCQYTFVQCAAGADSELDAAVDWIERYATKYAGRVITNFDEQRPVLADAPLSYQRLVAKTYDKTVIERFHGTINVDRIDRVVQESVTAQYYGEVKVENKIKVTGGSAIINIDSVLNNVTQSIGAAPGLDAAQKSQLEVLVNSLKMDLDGLKVTHADEAKAIAEALEKAVSSATKPALERKQTLLQLTAKGLKDAAELVKDVAPSILTTAGLVAKFIVGL